MTDDRSIDMSKPHPARRYDYWLGGKDNFAADRQSADQIERFFPTIRVTVRENRAFLRRAVGHLTAERGIRQFLDIGTGLPSADNTHEVAQRIAPESRVVYADNDPLVLVHARALLTGAPQGATDYLDADLRDPDRILSDPRLRDTLDLNRPVALILVAVLHFIHGDGAAQPIVARLLDALPSGSYLVATHATTQFGRAEQRAEYRRMVEDKRSDVWPRDHDEFAALFAGLELIEPGVAPISDWRPEAGAAPVSRETIGMWGAVGRKP